MKESIDQQLIKRYLDNACSEHERIQVEKWLAETEEWAFHQSSAELNEDTKDRVWRFISRRIKSKHPIGVKLVRFTSYVAAASMLIFVIFSKETSEESPISANSPLLKIEKIRGTRTFNQDFHSTELYTIYNDTDEPILLTTKTNGRVHRIEQRKTYLTICLGDDPGVMGDQIVVLSRDQLDLIPDTHFATELFAVIGNDALKASTLNYL